MVVVIREQGNGYTVEATINGRIRCLSASTIKEALAKAKAALEGK